jgi:hypothetical protein
MNTKTTKILFAALATSLGIKSVYAQQQQAPAVIISSTASQEQYVKLINVLNNSTAYSLVTSKVLNGSGNNAIGPKIPVLKPVAMAMDQLSYFDLYFQKSFSQAQIGPMRVDLHLLPFENAINNATTVTSKQIETSVNGLSDAVGEFAKATVKIQSYETLNSKENLNLIRQSEISALRQRYPVQESSPSGRVIDQVKWLVSSYLPISVSAQAEVTAANKTLKSTFVMPAIGYPKVRALASSINGPVGEGLSIIPMHFSSKGTANTIKMEPIVSNAAIFTDVTFVPNEARRAQLKTEGERILFDQMNEARVFRVELLKNLNSTHLIDAAFSFGYLNRNNPTSVYDMNVDLPASPDQARSLVQNSDMGMVIKGDVKFNRQMIADPAKLKLVNDYLASMFEIRLVFHKVYMRLNRLPISDASLKYLESAANVRNLDAYLNKDIGFELKNSSYVPDLSTINVIVSVKPEVLNQIKSAKPRLQLTLDPNVIKADTAYNAQILARKLLLFNFCVGTDIANFIDQVPDIPDDKLTNCQLSASSLDEFRSNFISKFLNNKAVGILQGELVSSAQGQANQGSKALDRAIEDVMTVVLSEMQKAKAYAAERLIN